MVEWNSSDRLAVALACLAGIMALVLVWVDKTPVWAGVTIGCMLALIIYPVIHFCALGDSQSRRCGFFVGRHWNFWMDNLAPSRRFRGTCSNREAAPTGTTSAFRTKGER
jgi:hypothetical protein